MGPITIDALPEGGWEVVHRELAADLETACAIAERMADALSPKPIQKRKGAASQPSPPITAIAA